MKKKLSSRELDARFDALSLEHADTPTDNPRRAVIAAQLVELGVLRSSLAAEPSRFSFLISKN